jgi:succinoglycan biosynthesis transport protein ExoP
VTSVVACMLGGLTLMAIAPPRYMGSARVMLDYIRPDPVTGTVVSSKMLDAYLASQLRLLRDNQVAIPAAEAMGWLDNPDVQAAYAGRPASDRREFPDWVAAQVVGGTSAHMVPETNIMEINYAARSPELSTAVADAIRNAYIQSSIDTKRTSMRAAADATADRIARLRKELAALDAQHLQLQRESGVTVATNGRDQESMRLSTMAGSMPHPVLVTSLTNTPAQAQLRELDAAIALRAPALGPNNPALIAMQRQREILRNQVESERDTVASREAALNQSNRASTQQLEQQKTKVLGLSQTLMNLRLIQDELDRKHDEFERLTTTAVELRQQSNQSAGSIAPVGAAKSSDEPVFPNRPLVVFASLGLGLVLGCLVAVFIELMARRVRAPEQLEILTGLPVLAVVPNLRRRRNPPAMPRLVRRGVSVELVPQ